MENENPSSAQQTAKPMASLIIPCRNEERFIGKVLDDLLAQDYPAEKMEILVADGRSDDRTREIVEEKSRTAPCIRLIDNPEKIVPFGLNRAIREARGEFIIRIDAHCEYPVNYVSRLVEVRAAENADNVGGICITLPGNETLTARAIALATSSGFGVGNSYFRIGVNKITEVDTVPFGCFSKSLFTNIGLFDEELVRNQDDEFNARIIKNGGRILLVPDLKILYYARSTISRMMKMFYQYGLFKPLVNKKIGKATTSRQLVPFFFVSYLLFLWPLCLINPSLALLYLSGLTLYFSLNLLVSLKIAFQNKKPSLFPLLFLLFFLIHLSYGWGYIAGLLRFRLLKNRTASTDVKMNR